MNKYDNHVYLVICEVSFSLFKETKFATYSQYCRVRNYSIKDFSDSQLADISDILRISKVLEHIFSMDYKTSMKYIVDFFHLEKYLVFEKAVRSLKEFFPNAGSIYLP